MNNESFKNQTVSVCEYQFGILILTYIKLSYLDVVFVSCLDQAREVCILRIDFIRVHELHQRLQGGNFHILQIMKKIIGAESRNYTGI